MAQFTIQQTFDLALQHHQAGRLQKAERLYRKIVAERPNHADAFHMLGVVAGQTGRLDEAVELIRRAISLNHGLSKAHNNLGNILRQKGQVDEAIAACRQAIALKSVYPEAYNNLGNGLKDKGKIDEAIAAYRQAIIFSPNFADAHNNLGNTLKDKGLVDEAIAAYRKAIAASPSFAEAHNNLGGALKDKGKIDEAIAAYRGSIALRPNYAEAYNDLGNALKEKGELDEAIAAYRRAMSLRPGWAMPCLNLGQLLREHGRLEEACLAFEGAAECEPGSSDAHNCQAMALAELQRFEEAKKALECGRALAPESALTHEAQGMILARSGHGAEAVDSFRRAVEIAPESVSGWNNLSQALRQIGRFDEAAECMRQILARRPGAVQAYSLMAGVGARADEAEMARLMASADDPQTSIRDRATLGFVLGKMLDDADRFDEAFAQYARANGLVLEMRRAAGEQYSSDLFAKRIDGSMSQFTRDFFSRARDWGEGSELPVFIVGMPRSGTSLVEQIASSHPDVFGAGELREMGDVATSLNLGECEPGGVKDAAGKQVERLRGLGGAALRVIDKMPSNVEHLGLIATLFPSARVIFCRRDPRDTCLSCFFQQFSAGNLFSFDLAQCGRHHVLSDRLIDHWLKVLPVRMLEVRYEDLVADLEGQSRRIIGFLDLAWNPACLDFHRTERTVLTSSDWQVRQPIYTRSVGRWRNYERHLGSLIESLGLRG